MEKPSIIWICTMGVKFMLIFTVAMVGQVAKAARAELDWTKLMEKAQVRVAMEAKAEMAETAGTGVHSWYM